MLPLSGVRSPAIRFKRVDLPLPFSPKIPIFCPFVNLYEKFLITGTAVQESWSWFPFGKFLLTLWSSRTFPPRRFPFTSKVNPLSCWNFSLFISCSSLWIRALILVPRAQGPLKSHWRSKRKTDSMRLSVFASISASVSFFGQV